jgi:hypothetical protein
MLGSSVVSYGIVDVPLRLERSSRTCEGRLRRTVSPDVSGFATANAKTVVKAPFLLWSKLVDLVHLHGVECLRADVAVRWEVMSSRIAKTVALATHGFKVIFIVEGLNVVELDSREWMILELIHDCSSKFLFAYKFNDIATSLVKRTGKIDTFNQV